MLSIFTFAPFIFVEMPGRKCCGCVKDQVRVVSILETAGDDNEKALPKNTKTWGSIDKMLDKAI